MQECVQFWYGGIQRVSVDIQDRETRIELCGIQQGIGPWRGHGMERIMGAMSKRKFYRLAILFIVGLILTISIQAPAQEDFSTSLEKTEHAVTAEQITTTTNAIITRTVDGDTVEAKMDSGDEVKIRLLGINTPESVDPRRPVECFGKEASKYMKDLAEGKRVRLEADIQADDIDKYGRLLRNIILGDGTDINVQMVRDGYAYAYTEFPLNKNRKAELIRLEQEARTAERGLWNPETCAGLK